MNGKLRSTSATDTAAPTILAGGSMGSENDGQGQSFTWGVSDTSGLSSLSVVIERDGQAIFTTTDTAQAAGSFAFESHGLGNYVLSVSATDAGEPWN